MSLTHIDLFSGIGGFAIAAQWAGFKTVVFVEIEPYAQEVIKERFGAVVVNSNGTHGGAWGESERSLCEQLGTSSKIYSDIFTFDGTPYRGATLLTGGFPCQPFSQAGKRRGKEDDRYLWPEMLRVISEARPAWVIGENVAGIVTMELDRCVSDLESEGYAVQPLIIPTCAVDAKHRRDRVWIVGHATEFRRNANRPQRGSLEQGERKGRMQQPSGASEDVADAEGRSIGTGLCESEQTEERRRRSSHCHWQDEGEWFAESGMGRVASRISNRVDRLKGLGNAIVPQAAYEIIKVIAEIENEPNQITQAAHR